jgi:AcrR family transcriptional regulator
MAPEQRRAAIVAATVPLLREHGLSVSTRQIATAAGVAEGTLFGVFPDKGALIRAAVISTFDPEPAVCALREIDPGKDLRQRLAIALDILRDRFDRNAAIIAALRAAAGMRAAPSTEDLHVMREFRAQLERSRTRILAALVELIEPDRALLRRSPTTAAHLLFMMMMANARGAFVGAAEPIDSAEIVTLILDGLLKPRTHAHGGRST